MANISANDVKALREKTGAGMMECKNALVETDGDQAAAEKLLKEKGLAAIEQRSGRATKEGKIFIKAGAQAAALVEVLSETDFVAKNPEFIALGEKLSARALEKNLNAPDDELTAMVTELATKIRENMTLSRIKTVSAGAGEYLATYTHGDGALGVVVKLGADKADALGTQAVKDFAHGLALHVAAFNPKALDSTKVDQAWLKEQEGIFRAQMDQDEAMKGKPENVRENILKGKVSKFLKDICFVDQGYVKDEKMSVAKALAETGKACGAELSIRDFVYMKVGE
jgi:elongation factor Ts